MEETMPSLYITKTGSVRCGGAYANDGGISHDYIENNGCGGGTKCGRWNPTTEQVRVLTELFRAGLRTPSIDQIQKISTQLSFYGKIESKNVFYWFQNHKARERLKRRRTSPDAEIKEKICRGNAISSTTYLGEVVEAAPVMETLQLFPVSSYQECEPLVEKHKYHATDLCKEATFAYTICSEMEHPPLDLRLSFH